MKFSVTLLLFVNSIFLFAQDSFYNYIDFGDYNVAFSDTIIYYEDQAYNQFGYNGPLPIFTKIWFPTGSEATNYLTFEDFQDIKVPIELSKVHTYLKAQIDSFFVKSYFQTYEIKGYYDIQHTPTDFGKYSNSEVINTLKHIKTQSLLEPLNKKVNYPIIIYHHGAQSSAEENYLLAEFFASNGYIVVSASYQLPFENRIYGFEPEEFDDTALPKRVTEFARTISNNPNIYFIGHSAGAQVGFHYLYEPRWASGFVSLETSTEFWRKQSIRKGWKSLYKVVRNHRKDYTLPILMVANTGSQINPFPLFNEIENAPMIHASSKVYFDHESYTSLYHMRYLFRDQIPQKDSNNSKSQLELYINHLKLIEAFLSSLENNSKLETVMLSENFFFTKFNND